MLNKIECVDLCSKYAVVALKIFENENEKIRFLYSEEHENSQQMNKLLLILFSLLNSLQPVFFCFFFVVGELKNS